MSVMSSGSSSFACLVKEVNPPPTGGDLKFKLNESLNQLDPRDELGTDQLTGRAYADDQFLDGFVVDGDHSTIEPTAPFEYKDAKAGVNTMSQTPLPRQVFSLQADPKNQLQPLKKKIAIVRDIKPNDNFLNQDYFYKVFTYGDARKQSDLKYVFTGSADAPTPGGHVKHNVFIPFDILRTRLSGNWEQRQEAYTRDWLTVCNYAIQDNIAKQLAPQQIPIPAAILPEHWDTVTGIRTKLASYDGSHLLARKSNGELPDKMGAEFLYLLLKPPSTMSMKHLSRHIFQRWCRVATLAAAIEKEPFSVKARFWRIPRTVQGNSDIELMYQMMPGWWDQPNNPKILQDSKLSQEFRQLLGEVEFKFNQTTEAKLFEAWDGFMNEVFAAALTSADSTLDQLPYQVANDNPVRVRFRLLSPRQSLVGLKLLGSHPQGFYSTYIKETDKDRLSQLGYKLETIRPFPKQADLNAIVSGTNLQQTNNTQEMTQTQTSISKTNLQVAGDHPRIRTQNAVMNGVSANEIAGKIPAWQQTAPERRRAEWLHRSAYSYGGNGNPDSSQIKENLVFGTIEANTEMIRYEDYLKRMVDKSPGRGLFNPFLVHLTTFLNRSKGPGGGVKSLPWLVPHLGYEWSFDVNHVFTGDLLVNAGPEGGKIKKRVDFDLFSRKYPMRYEVEVDEGFDEKIRTAPPLIQAARALFLVSQANAFDYEMWRAPGSTPHKYYKL